MGFKKNRSLKCAQYIAYSFFAIVAAILLATAFPFSPEFSTPVAFSAGALGALLALVSASYALGYLGFILCVLPFFGTGVLSFVVACVVSAGFLREAWLSKSTSRNFSELSNSPSHLRNSRLAAAVFLFGLLATFSIVHAAFYEVDVEVLRSVWQHGGLQGIIQLLLSDVLRWNKLPVAFFQVVIALLLLVLVWTQRASHKLVPLRLVDGLALGSLVAALTLVLQLAKVPFALINRAAFWEIENRYPASFSDPNAFGLMCALFLPWLLVLGYRQRRVWWLASGVVLLCLVPWSGSRSCWLGFFCWLVLYGGSYALRQNYRRAFLYTALGLTVVVSGIAVLGNPALNESLQTHVKAPAATRILKSIHWETVDEMALSRVLYARIAFKVWRDNPIFGIGWGRFYEQQASAAQELGIDLQGWRDNPNNYYLQVLVESGIFGFALFLGVLGLLVSLFSVRERFPGRESHVSAEEALILGLGKKTLLVLLCLFLLGPHLHFDEVRFFVSLVLALTIDATGVSQFGLQKVVWGTAAMVFAALLYLFLQMSPRHEKGFYALEHGSEGFFAWSSDRGEFAVCSGEGSTLSLHLRSFQPGLSERPLVVTIFSRKANEIQEEFVAEQKIITTEWHTIDVPWDYSRKGTVVLRVDRVWNPAAGSARGDARYLGALLRWPKEACLQP